MPRALAATATATAVFFICSYSSFGFSNRVGDPSSSASAGAFPPRHSDDIRNRPSPLGSGWSFTCLLCRSLARHRNLSGHDERWVWAFMTETKTVLKPTEGEYPCRKWRTRSLFRHHPGAALPRFNDVAALILRIPRHFVASGQYRRSPADHRPVVASGELSYTAHLPSPGACSSP